MSDDVVDAQDLLITLGSIKSALDVLGKQKSDIEERLIALIEAQGSDKITAKTSDGGVLRGVVVRAERVVIDAEALQKRLTPSMWKKVTVPVLDKALLEAHVVTKDVDEQVVADCTEIKPNKPYVKVTGDLPTVTGLEQVTVVGESGREKPALKRVRAKKAAAG